MGKLVSIYGLIDPRDGSCFYIGRTYTHRLRRRLNEHIAAARREGPASRKNSRILEILAAGSRPDIETLEEVDESVWSESERGKIDEYREFCELVNAAPGGQGPSNLNEVFTQAWEGNPERRRLVAQQSRERWKDPEYRRMMIESARARFSAPEYKQYYSDLQHRVWADNEEGKRRISEARKENWQDPDYRERVTQANVEAWSDPGLLTSHAERTAAMWQDPEYREKVVDRLNDPEVQGRRAEKLGELWQDEEKRERQAATMREHWDDPDNRARRLESLGRAVPKIAESMRVYYEEHPEARERQSEVAARLMEDPERRHNLSKKIAGLWEDPAYREQQHRTRNRGKLRPDVERAAERLGVKVTTVYKYCHQGRLGRKVDGLWVITDEDLDRFQR